MPASTSVSTGSENAFASTAPTKGRCTVVPAGSPAAVAGSAGGVRARRRLGRAGIRQPLLVALLQGRGDLGAGALRRVVTDQHLPTEDETRDRQRLRAECERRFVIEAGVGAVVLDDEFLHLEPRRAGRELVDEGSGRLAVRAGRREEVVQADGRRAVGGRPVPELVGFRVRRGAGQVRGEEQAGEGEQSDQGHCGVPELDKDPRMIPARPGLALRFSTDAICVDRHRITFFGSGCWSGGAWL